MTPTQPTTVTPEDRWYALNYDDRADYTTDNCEFAIDTLDQLAQTTTDEDESYEIEARRDDWVARRDEMAY